MILSGKYEYATPPIAQVPRVFFFAADKNIEENSGTVKSGQWMTGGAESATTSAAAAAGCSSPPSSSPSSCPDLVSAYNVSHPLVQLGFVIQFLRSSIGWLAITVATYWPSRSSELMNKNVTQYGARSDETGCTSECWLTWLGRDLWRLKEMYFPSKGHKSNYRRV